jgi:hypothetical protein
VSSDDGRVPPGPGSPQTGLSLWGGDPSSAAAEGPGTPQPPTHHSRNYDPDAPIAAQAEHLSPNHDIHQTIVRRVRKERSLKEGVSIVLLFQVL